MWPDSSPASLSDRAWKAHLGKALLPTVPSRHSEFTLEMSSGSDVMKQDLIFFVLISSSCLTTYYHFNSLKQHKCIMFAGTSYRYCRLGPAHHIKVSCNLFVGLAFNCTAPVKCNKANGNKMRDACSSGQKSKWVLRG